MDRAIMKLHDVETLNIVNWQGIPPNLFLLHSEAHELITQYAIMALISTDGTKAHYNRHF